MAISRLQENLLAIQRRTLLAGRRGQIEQFKHRDFAFPYVTGAVLKSFRLKKKERGVVEAFFEDPEVKSYSPHLELSRELGVERTKDLLAMLARKVALIKTVHVQIANTQHVRRSLLSTAGRKNDFEFYRDAVAQSLLAMHLKASEWRKALTGPEAAFDAVKFAEGWSHPNAADLRAFLTEIHGKLAWKP